MDLNTEDIERAIYLDFESTGKKPNKEQPPPVLAGVVIEGVYAPTLLDPDLAHASEANEWGQATLADYLQSILDQAKSEQRTIVFFDSPEFAVLKDHGVAIGDSGVDLRDLAKSSNLYTAVWETFNDSERRFSDPETAQPTRDALRTNAFDLLTLIAEELGMDRPHPYGAGKTGARLRYALKYARSKNDYETWSPGAKRKLLQAVGHNEHDCKAMRFVLDHLAVNG